MIAKMKKTVIAAARSQKDELLSSLRDLGVMHVSDMVSKSQSLDAMEKERAEYDRVMQALKERGGKKAKGGKALKGEEFSKLHASLVSLLSLTDGSDDSPGATGNTICLVTVQPAELLLCLHSLYHRTVIHVNGNR